MDKHDSAIEQDQLLINRITYLASLSSQAKVIDPMLDTLRSVTARRDDSKRLGDEDHTQLIKLEGELKNFLIKKDPLRSFTAEDLEDRIRLRETKKSRLNTYPMAILLSAIAAGLMYLLPSSILSLDHKNLTAACTFMLVSQLITVWFYLSNLKNFKKEFRQAFVYLSVGVVPLGVLFGQLGISPILGVGDAPAFRYAGVSYFATLAFICMYLGLRKYTQLLQIKTAASSVAGIFTVSALTAIAMALVPHASKPTYELFFDISLAAIMVAFVFALANAVLIHKIMRLVTMAYRKPLLVLYVYMYAAIFGTATAAGAMYILGDLYGATLAIVITVAAIPQQLLLMYSGYQFEKYIGR
jgi:ABC-type multidrug transport system fused ATPase/permease subunit